MENYKKTLIAGLFYIFLPLTTSSVVYAASATGAGFVTGSVFFSHTPPVEGSSVLIYASVMNSSEEVFSGRAIFNDASEEIGSVAVVLSPAEARIVSISWTPTVGKHSISAALKNTGGTEVASAGGLTSSATITVTATPKPAVSTTQTEKAEGVEPSVEIQKAVEYVSPPVAEALQPAFVALDGARQSATYIIDGQLAKSKAIFAKKQSVEKAQTTTASSTPSQNSILGTAWQWTAMLYFYILSALRFGIANPLIFYPLVVALFFWLMFKLYKRMTRPRFDRY